MQLVFELCMTLALVFMITLFLKGKPTIGSVNLASWRLIIAGLIFMLFGSVIGVLDSSGLARAPMVAGWLDFKVLTANILGHVTGFVLISFGLAKWFNTTFVLLDTRREPEKANLELEGAREKLKTELQQRQKAECALARSEIYYRTIFERAGDAIFVLELDGPTVGTIVDANRAAGEMHGYSREELIGMKISDLEVPEDATKLPDRLERVRTGEWLKDEVTHSREDGSVFPLEINAGKITVDGHDYVMAMDRDISRRRAAENEKACLEDQLRHSQRMEAVGTLAGGIAHDFNNILAVIMGFGELALEDNRQGKPSPDNLETVLEAARRARDLVIQILTFSRQMESRKVFINLNGLISESVRMLERVLPKMIHIETMLGLDVRPIVGDPVQVDQVVINIANNAKDAMPDGGRLLIKTENIVLDDEYTEGIPGLEPGRYVRLSISDNGAGIDDRTMEHIFDPFFTDKEVGQGTGLGLATVHGILRNHGGHVTCYSNPGEGTTFNTYWPVDDEQSTRPLDQTAAEPGGEKSGGTILVVDDEEALRMLAVRILGQSGYRTLTASSGEEALEIYGAQGEHIDLVLTDIGMPGMGGHKLVEHLRELNEDVRIVVASGYALEAGDYRLPMDGRTGFVAKPFEKRHLLAAISEGLTGGDGKGAD